LKEKGTQTELNNEKERLEKDNQLKQKNIDELSQQLTNFNNLITNAQILLGISNLGDLSSFLAINR